MNVRNYESINHPDYSDPSHPVLPKIDTIDGIGE